MLKQAIYTVVGASLALLSTATTANEATIDRLITAGGTLTDIVFALGGADRVIGVDTSSTSPAAVHDKAKVGYYRNLSAEGVLSFKPSHLWVLEGAGSERSLEQIKKAGVPVEQFDKPTSLPALYQLIEQVATKLSATDQAEQVIARIQQDFTAVEREQELTGLFVLQVSERGVIAAGSETVPNLLFSQSDINNVFAHQGFKTISREYLLANQPDFIVAPSHVVNGQGGRQAFCEKATLQLLTAGQDCRLLVMDSLLALGMTTRIAEAHKVLLEYVDDL